MNSALGWAVLLLLLAVALATCDSRCATSGQAQGDASRLAARSKEQPR